MSKSEYEQADIALREEQFALEQRTARWESFLRFVEIALLAGAFAGTTWYNVRQSKLQAEQFVLQVNEWRSDRNDKERAYVREVLEQVAAYVGAFRVAVSEYEVSRNASPNATFPYQTHRALVQSLMPRVQLACGADDDVSESLGDLAAYLNESNLPMAQKECSSLLSKCAAHVKAAGSRNRWLKNTGD